MLEKDSTTGRMLDVALGVVRQHFAEEPLHRKRISV
jgi:hypothetical protein